LNVLMRRVDGTSLDLVRRFLETHIETSVFLLACLDEHGPTISDSQRSGNFYYIEQDAQVAAVCSLTRKGDLLVQTGGRQDFGAQIVETCGAEPIPVKGVVAEWRAASSVWDALTGKPGFKGRFRSKQVVYRIGLASLPTELEISSMVRRLTESDFEPWDVLYRQFVAEMGWPDQTSREQRQVGFRRRAAEGHSWGAFQHAQLIGTAGLDMSCTTAAQIANVYTIPTERRQGVARSMLQTLLRASAEDLGLKVLVLFTPSDNVRARQLYKSLGFRTCGHFGLMLGSWDDDPEV
jgi:ribosomal protein S18 acetylase RimI-like enzyme